GSAMTPGIQVRLAKRFVRPGSNKITCLAAQTSVPLHDDELASVSNLALKLSDGTNVVMSLSFFDDAAGIAPPVLTANRSVINPNLYEIKTDSARLSKVLIAMALGGFLGCWLSVQKPFADFHNFVVAKTVMFSAGTKQQQHAKTGHITSASVMTG